MRKWLKSPSPKWWLHSWERLKSSFIRCRRKRTVVQTNKKTKTTDQKTKQSTQFSKYLHFYKVTTVILISNKMTLFLWHRLLLYSYKAIRHKKSNLFVFFFFFSRRKSRLTSPVFINVVIRAMTNVLHMA